MKVSKIFTGIVFGVALTIPGVLSSSAQENSPSFFSESFNISSEEKLVINSTMESLYTPLGYEQVQEKIKDVLSTDDSLSNYGYLEESEDGVLRLMLSKDRNALDIFSAEPVLLNQLKGINVMIEYSLEYTPEEIDNIATLIFNEIRDYYQGEIDPETTNFRIIQDYKEQKIILSQDLSKEKLLDQKLIDELTVKFADILKFEEEESIQTFKAISTKMQGWNDLGGGLGVNFLGGDKACTNTGILHKQGTYFFLTAGYCFTTIDIFLNSRLSYKISKKPYK